MRNYENSPVKKRKTYFVSTFDSLIWLDDLYRVGGDVGDWRRGERFSFRDADVVPFTFEVD